MADNTKLSPAGNPLPPKKKTPSTLGEVAISARREKVSQMSDALKQIAAHTVEKMDSYKKASDEQKDAIMRDALMYMKETLDTDVEGFDALMSDYLKDFEADRVASENKVDQTSLESMGVSFKQRGGIYKGASKAVGRHARKHAPSTKELVGTDILQPDAIAQQPSNVFDMLFGKGASERKTESEEGSSVKLDKKKFENDEKYRTALLQYAKDLKAELKLGNKLSAEDNKLLKDLAKHDKYKDARADPASVLSPFEGMVFNAGKAIAGAALSGTKSLIKSIDKKLVKEKKEDVPKVEEVSKEAKPTDAANDSSYTEVDTSVGRVDVISGPVIDLDEKVSNPNESANDANIEPIAPEDVDNGVSYVFGPKDESANDANIEPLISEPDSANDANIEPLISEPDSANNANIEPLISESDSATDDTKQNEIERLGDEASKREEKTIELLEEIRENTDPENEKKKEEEGSPLEGIMSLLTGTLGKALPAIGALVSSPAVLGALGVGAAGAAGVAVGTGISEGYEAISGDSLGSDIYDLFNPEDSDEAKAAKNTTRITPRVEPIKKARVEETAQNTERAEQATEQRQDNKSAAVAAQTAAMVVNAPQSAINVSGASGGAQSFKEQPRNPDTSFTKWRDSRVGYI